MLQCCVRLSSGCGHLGDRQVGDIPTRRHESVNSATIYFLPLFLGL